ncbi:TMEM175 family protein [Nocardia sp. NPDC006630]|uniref:TMEM175 family protein n=1 Tax=Nocardia sp. NPDC006630 TaxID=3157181 RepID=UPI0033BD566E
MTAPEAGPVRTQRGLERLIYFSDAVVAIAITLIALPLVDSARDVASSSTAKFLSDNSYALTAAGVSFVVISVLWRDHHRLFERATGYTPRLLRVNMVWLLCIVALPVATVLDVYSQRHDRLAVGLYVGVLVVAQATIRIEEFILYRAGMLADIDQITAEDLAVRWINVAATAIALVVAVALPQIGLWSLLILVVSGQLEAFAHRRKKARTTPAD